MFKHYYVDKKANPSGAHLVHAEDCPNLPDLSNREYLGIYDSTENAIKKAQMIGYKLTIICSACFTPITVK